jgi:hypothetical protein
MYEKSDKKAFEAYQEFLAIKRHFNSNYDFFKYNGKVKASFDSLMQKRDRYKYYVLGGMKERKERILANILKNPKVWVGDIVSKDGETVYREFKKRLDSLDYVFSQEMEKLDLDFRSNFVVKDGNSLPNLVKLYIMEEISLETFLILREISGFGDVWATKLKGNPVYDDIRTVCENYKPFLSIDYKKFRRVVYNKLKTVETQN